MAQALLNFYIKGDMIEIKTRQIKIVVLEDNSFYNKLIKAQIEKCFAKHNTNSDIEFKLNVYQHVEDLYLNLHHAYDIAFIDYFLGSGITGNVVIPPLKQHNSACKVALMSLHEQSVNRLTENKNKAEAFIAKDGKSLQRICDFIHLYAKEKYPELS